MDPIRQAIVQRLTADSTLTAMLSSAGAVYHRRATRSAFTPYVVFNLNGGGTTALFNGAKITDDVWLVKAVDHNTSASVAENIDRRISQLLHGATLTLTDGTTASVFQQSYISYEEEQGDDTWQHVGHTYRFIDP
jgi:hypothetical protein